MTHIPAIRYTYLPFPQNIDDLRRLFAKNPDRRAVIKAIKDAPHGVLCQIKTIPAGTNVTMGTGNEATIKIFDKDCSYMIFPLLFYHEGSYTLIYNQEMRVDVRFVNGQRVRGEQLDSMSHEYQNENGKFKTIDMPMGSDAIIEIGNSTLFIAIINPQEEIN